MRNRTKASMLIIVVLVIVWSHLPLVAGEEIRVDVGYTVRFQKHNGLTFFDFRINLTNLHASKLNVPLLVLRLPGNLTGRLVRVNAFVHGETLETEVNLGKEANFIVKLNRDINPGESLELKIKISYFGLIRSIDKTSYIVVIPKYPLLNYAINSMNVRIYLPLGSTVKSSLNYTRIHTEKEHYLEAKLTGANLTKHPQTAELLINHTKIQIASANLKRIVSFDDYGGIHVKDVVTILNEGKAEVESINYAFLSNVSSFKAQTILRRDVIHQASDEGVKIILPEGLEGGNRKTIIVFYDLKANSEIRGLLTPNLEVNMKMGAYLDLFIRNLTISVLSPRGETIYFRQFKNASLIDNIPVKVSVKLPLLDRVFPYMRLMFIVLLVSGLLGVFLRYKVTVKTKKLRSIDEKFVIDLGKELELVGEYCKLVDDFIEKKVKHGKFRRESSNLYGKITKRIKALTGRGADLKSNLEVGDVVREIMDYLEGMVKYLKDSRDLDLRLFSGKIGLVEYYKKKGDVNRKVKTFLRKIGEKLHI